jgi:hypothetical protein
MIKCSSTASFCQWKVIGSRLALHTAASTPTVPLHLDTVGRQKEAGQGAREHQLWQVVQDVDEVVKS